MNISPASIQLQIASFRGQALSDLMDTTSAGTGAATFADFLDSATSASTPGRNAALRDPEAAYGMMTTINKLEVDFKAQYSELDAMGDAVEYMEEAARSLSSIDPTTANADVVAQLQTFVSQYNNWEDRFDHTVADGGVLDNIQAAEISLYELEQGVRSMFNGAADGVNGLEALGITIDPVTRQASLDVAKLESVLNGNRTGAVSAIDEFSANFAKSADLLNTEGNFIPTQLDNRSRAIDFIADNRQSLEAEFGMGDAARPTGDTARALAAYNLALGIA